MFSKIITFSVALFGYSLLLTAMAAEPALEQEQLIEDTDISAIHMDAEAPKDVFILEGQTGEVVKKASDEAM